MIGENLKTKSGVIKHFAPESQFHYCPHPLLWQAVCHQFKGKLEAKKENGKSEVSSPSVIELQLMVIILLVIYRWIV